MPLAVTGGQIPAHAPVHVGLPPLSPSNRYTVLPSGPTRAGSPMSLTDFSDTVAAPPSGALAGLLAAGEAVASGGELCGVELPDPLDPQAASINPAITAPAALATRVRTFPPSIGAPIP